MKNSKGNNERLFHFFEDNSRPWAKRCDFVLFQKAAQNILVFAFEFKSKSINADTIKAQLERTEHWCKSVQTIISNYTGDKVVFQMKKFVLTENANPSAYLGDQDKYLNVDSKIRHLNYKEVDGKILEKLDHNRNIRIR